jgi:hypothetical protein
MTQHQVRTRSDVTRRPACIRLTFIDGGGSGKAYLARIEDLGRGDLVQINCAACHHVALLTPAALLKLGLSPAAKVLELKWRVRCHGMRN